MITPRDRFIVAMKAVIAPVGQARNDHDIMRGISREMGVESQFTENRGTADWLKFIYDESRSLAKMVGTELPSYDEFLSIGWHETEHPTDQSDAFTAFRNDPLGETLKTPSGKIEITSQKIASPEYAKILPYPAWYEPIEWLGQATDEFPFHLISSQPADKLHSQLDQGRTSRSAKLDGRTPLLIHPEDAKKIGISDGSCVRIYNQRGACLATAKFDTNLARNVVQMSTGAWLDATPQDDGTLLCRHGNPNMVTHDCGTSELAQGPVAHSCLVAVESFDPVHPIEAFLPPSIQ